MNPGALSIVLDQLIRPVLTKNPEPNMVSQCCGAIFVGKQAPGCARCKKTPKSVVVSSVDDIPKIAGQLSGLTHESK